jgi:C4-dicarboxylate-specific signal transduction histidine kinase
VNNAVDSLRENNVADPRINISVESSKEDNTIRIIIHDNGPGIPENIRTTLFEPFVTCRKKNGTGLGLAIVKQYITAHSGEIKAENDNGASFTITLPIEN